MVHHQHAGIHSFRVPGVVRLPPGQDCRPAAAGADAVTPTLWWPPARSVAVHDVDVGSDGFVVLLTTVNGDDGPPRNSLPVRACCACLGLTDVDGAAVFLRCLARCPP